MAASVWSGHLTFGLVSIPMRLFSAARSKQIAFNQLHKGCKSRVRQPLFCPTCNRQIERSEIVKGYEYEKDQYVLVEETELEKVAPPTTRTMEILEFVRAADVDPIYLDASYFVVPEEAGRKAYQLLLKALADSDHAAIAKLSMHKREHTVVLRPRDNGLTLHTLFYPSEINQVAEYGQGNKTEVKEQELKLAEQLVESLAADFDPERYRDEYQERVKSLIDAKLEGKEVATPPQPRLAPVVDLMEALKKSLAGRQAQQAVPKKPPVRAVTPMEASKTRKKSTG